MELIVTSTIQTYIVVCLTFGFVSDTDELYIICLGFSECANIVMIRRHFWWFFSDIQCCVEKLLTRIQGTENRPSWILSSQMNLIIVLASVWCGRKSSQTSLFPSVQSFIHIWMRTKTPVWNDAYSTNRDAFPCVNLLFDLIPYFLSDHSRPPVTLFLNEFCCCETMLHTHNKQHLHWFTGKFFSPFLPPAHEGAG